MESLGHKHPIMTIIREMVDIFGELGFAVADGPELESDYHNFGSLNFPPDHPARDMHDTFWVTPKDGSERKLLRTHTSTVQVPYMKSHEPPIRIVYPGKTYRYEATDATHEAQFHQFEGLMVDKDVSLAHLKGSLEFFFRKLFKTEVAVRFRPSYFPFVEPGLEVDMSCYLCGGKGCRLCKNCGWIEIMGAGSVQPSVLHRAGIDPQIYQGYAFGMGVERIAILRSGVPDVRLFNGGDLRVINQF